MNAANLGGMADGGERMNYTGGALREPEDGKGRCDLIEPEIIFRSSRWYELGAKKYGDRNWESGISTSRCISSAIRHLFKYLAGWRDEDHLAAVIWNCGAIMRWEGHNMTEFLDLPWQKEQQLCQQMANSTSSTTQSPRQV